MHKFLINQVMLCILQLSYAFRIVVKQLQVSPHCWLLLHSIMCSWQAENLTAVHVQEGSHLNSATCVVYVNDGHIGILALLALEVWVHNRKITSQLTHLHTHVANWLVNNDLSRNAMSLLLPYGFLGSPILL